MGSIGNMSRTILGIDPGTRYMGYAILRGDDSATPHFEAAAVESLIKIKDPYLRLARIHELVLELIARYSVTELAIEAPFYGKNAQSMLKLGRAQGVAIAASLSKGIAAVEYSPRRVKEVVTSRGDATKARVAQILNLQFPTVDIAKFESYDVTDALAIALCHFYVGEISNEKKSTQKKKTKSATSWLAFVTNNPSRVRIGNSTPSILKNREQD